MSLSMKKRLREMPSRASVAACSLLATMLTGIATNVVAAEAGQPVVERSQAERERKLEAARNRLDEAAREVAELSMALSDDAVPRLNRIITRQASRAMLGVSIGGDRQTERKDGVEILSVSPGGPAAKAGLKSGDIITELNDKPLKQDGAESAREQLLAIMRDVEPDSNVKVRYLRDGKAATAMVVAGRVDRLVSLPLRTHELHNLPTLALMRSHGVFGSSELVALTPKLGQYFGTEKGLLVVRAPDDSRLQLEEGDVIIDIDGRVPTSASHALRILASYQPGEKLKITVLRMKKRQTIDITIPEDVRRSRMDGLAYPGIPVPAPRAIPLPPPEMGQETA